MKKSTLILTTFVAGILYGWLITIAVLAKSYPFAAGLFVAAIVTFYVLRSGNNDSIYP